MVVEGARLSLMGRAAGALPTAEAVKFKETYKLAFVWFSAGDQNKLSCVLS